MVSLSPVAIVPLGSECLDASVRVEVWLRLFLVRKYVITDVKISS